MASSILVSRKVPVFVSGACVVLNDHTVFGVAGTYLIRTTDLGVKIVDRTIANANYGRAIVDRQGRVLILGTSSPSLRRIDPFTLQDDPPAINQEILDLDLDSQGRVVIGGRFTIVGSANRPYLARLNADGTFDTDSPGTRFSFRTGVVHATASMSS